MPSLLTGHMAGSGLTLRGLRWWLSWWIILAVILVDYAGHCGAGLLFPAIHKELIQPSRVTGHDKGGGQARNR
jgi:hypothetical protein